MSPEERAVWLKQPAMPAPPGVKPNFEHPANNFSYAFPLYLLVFIISNSVFAMKMYSQIRVIKQMRFEDWMLVIGWVSSLPRRVGRRHTDGNAVGLRRCLLSFRDNGLLPTCWGTSVGDA